jgi:hypothetical protein
MPWFEQACQSVKKYFLSRRFVGSKKSRGIRGLRVEFKQHIKLRARRFAIIAEKNNGDVLTQIQFVTRRDMRS